MMNILCNIVKLYQNNITRRIIMSHLKKTILPTGMLLFNIPNSLFVTFISALICKKLST